MSDGSIRLSCWKCGKEYRAGATSSGKVISCPGCGAANLAMDDSVQPSSPAKADPGVKCPTCGRRVRQDADECFNCGRPFKDPRKLDDFLRKEPLIKASLAKTISDRPEPAVRGKGFWIVVALAAAVAVLAIAAACAAALLGWL